MIAGYTIQHNPSTSSTSVAEGPGIVNFQEFGEWRLYTWRSLSKLKAPARIDLTEIYRNACIMHSDYALSAMTRRKVDHPDVIRLKQKFEDAKKSLEQYITLAILSGYTK